MRNFEDKLNAIKKKYIEIEKDLSQQDGIDPVKLVKLNKEYSELTTIVETINIYHLLKKDIENLNSLLNDIDNTIQAMAE